MNRPIGQPQIWQRFVDLFDRHADPACPKSSNHNIAVQTLRESRPAWCTTEPLASRRRGEGGGLTSCRFTLLAVGFSTDRAELAGWPFLRRLLHVGRFLEHAEIDPIAGPRSCADPESCCAASSSEPHGIVTPQIAANSLKVTRLPREG